MNPNVTKRKGINENNAEKKPSAVWNFMKLNTHHNITMKCQFMYIEDVKAAININYFKRKDHTKEVA